MAGARPSFVPPFPSVRSPQGCDSRQGRVAKPAAPPLPPTTGPAVNPIERVVSISPLARAASASGPAAAGTSANSAGWLTATPKPRSIISGSSAHRLSIPASTALTTAAWPSETTIRIARFSKRSTTAPATPAASTTGPQSAKISAETANPDPVCFCTWRMSGKIAMIPWTPWNE